MKKTILLLLTATLLLPAVAQAQTSGNTRSKPNFNELLSKVRTAQGQRQRRQQQAEQNVKAMVEAAERGDLATVKQKIEREGVALNAVGKYYGTALHAAARGGQLQVAKYLVEKCKAGQRNLFINAQDNSGHTALHNAVGNGDYAMVQFLVSVQANVEAEDDTQERPIAHLGHPSESFKGTSQYYEVAKFLVEDKHVELKADRFGYTPLHNVAVLKAEVADAQEIINIIDLFLSRNDNLLSMKDKQLRKLPVQVAEQYWVRQHLIEQMEKRGLEVPQSN